MSLRLVFAAGMLGAHFRSLEVGLAGFLLAWALGALRNELRGQLRAIETRLKDEIRRNR